MRFLLIACLLFLLFGVASLPVAGAAHQICLPLVSGQPVIASAQPGTLLINEVVLTSNMSWSCPGATLPPATTDTSWVEIYNTQNQPIDLYASRTTIDGATSPGTTPMSLPFGSAIAAHGFFTFFINKGTVFPNTIGPFSLRLLMSGTVIDQVTLPQELGTNQSYARVPDGASTWQISDTPTIGITNVLPTPTPAPLPKPTHTPIARTPIRAKNSNNTSRVTANKSTSMHTDTTISDGKDTAVGSGVQPAWSGLQLPGTVSSAHTSSSSTNTRSVDATTDSPATNSNLADILHKMLFITLAVGLVCGLYWCWRRFKRSRSRF